MITDWTLAYNEYRGRERRDEMDFTMWFFFNPGAFKLFHYGVPLLTFIQLAGVGYWALYKGYIWVALMSIIFFFVTGFIYKQYSLRLKDTKGKNFYDLWLREYQ